MDNNTDRGATYLAPPTVPYIFVKDIPAVYIKHTLYRYAAG